MTEERPPPSVPGFDGRAGEQLRRLLDVLDTLAAERLRLHGGDEQGAVMRLLLRQLLDGDGTGMPLLRLSRLTGFPRETLRRKLGPLLNKAFLYQDDEARYHIGAAYFNASLQSRRLLVEALKQLDADSL